MKKLLSAMALVSLLASCAGQTQREIQKEKSQMTNVNSREEMMVRMRKVLSHGKGITEKQKEQFMSMHDEVWSQTYEINQDIRKLKIMLFKELVNPKYNDQKVHEVKRQVQKLYNKKLNIMIGAFEKVTKMLGKDQRRFLHDHMFEEVHLHN